MGFLSNFAAPLGSLIGFAAGGPAGAAIGGTIGGSIGSSASSKEAIAAQTANNEANIAMQAQTNAQAIELANTAHQREVADLRAAGLNPILSVGGSGSATPTLTAGRSESLAPTILSSAKNRIDQQAQTMQTAQALSNLKVQSSQATLNSAQAVKAGQEAQRIAYENDALQQSTKRRQFEEEYRNSRPDYIKKFGLDVQDAVSTVVGPIRDLFKR